MVQDIIATSVEHLTVEQVYDRIRKNYPNIGMGTVYRNLNLLADEDEIGRLHIGGDPVRFEKNAKKHQHAVCTRCGKIMDIPNLTMDVMQELTGHDMKIQDQKLLVKVICRTCQR
jgi:Fur family peroxide stress response transcriptional regulator